MEGDRDDVTIITCKILSPSTRGANCIGGKHVATPKTQMATTHLMREYAIRNHLNEQVTTITFDVRLMSKYK
jgi:hypothetical protein